MSFIDQIKQRAKNEIKTIVLPEATDVRILDAAQIVKNEGYAKVILVGDEQKVRQLAKEKEIEKLTKKLERIRLILSIVTLLDFFSS